MSEVKIRLWMVGISCGAVPVLSAELLPLPYTNKPPLNAKIPPSSNSAVFLYENSIKFNLKP
jgi:hypothetical protein